jgi:hypothetical protein
MNLENIMSYKKKKKVITEHFYQNIDEEFICPNLYKSMVYKFFNGGKFVEVGTQKGKGIAFMGVEIINIEKNDITSIDCVGEWKNIENYSFTKFVNDMSPIIKLIKPIRGQSKNVVKEYNDKSLSFIFLGPHQSYENIECDLEIWLPKLKNGGVIAGRLGTDKTKEYLKKFFGEKNLSYYETEGCWVYENDNNVTLIEVDSKKITKTDYSFWAVIFEDLNGVEIYREDVDKTELDKIEMTVEGNYKIWRSIKENKIPHKWIVWPYSTSNGWCEKIEGYINI